jgi:hypothetical protein
MTSFPASSIKQPLPVAPVIFHLAACVKWMSRQLATSDSFSPPSFGWRMVRRQPDQCCPTYSSHHINFSQRVCTKAPGSGSCGPARRSDGTAAAGLSDPSNDQQRRVKSDYSAGLGFSAGLRADGRNTARPSVCRAFPRACRWSRTGRANHRQHDGKHDSEAKRRA